MQSIALTTKSNQTQHYIHQKHKRETEKTALVNKTTYTLIWYAFYDLRSGNGVGPILTVPEPTRGKWRSCSTPPNAVVITEIKLRQNRNRTNAKQCLFKLNCFVSVLFQFYFRCNHCLIIMSYAAD